MTVNECMRVIDSRRKALKMSYADLEQKSGISYHIFFHFRNGIYTHQINALFKIADTLGLEIVVKPKS